MEKVAEARKALRCLYVQVPESVARDVESKVEAAFASLERARTSPLEATEKP